MTDTTATQSRRGRKYLVLPDDADVGWTPFLWLVYLTIPFFHLVFGSPRPIDWVLACVSVALFLPLYFLGFWLCGTRLVALIAAITLLAIVYTPLNPGGCVYFIYAAAFVGYAAESGPALKMLIALLAILGVETLLADLPASAWGPGLLFTAIIGATGIHAAEVRRNNLHLRQARAEVERIAKVAERERIARDLHDLLGHTLTLIAIKSDLAVKLADRNPERSRAEMQEVHDTAREALAEVRRAVRGYRADGAPSADSADGADGTDGLDGLRREIENARSALASAGIEVTSDGAEPGALVRALGRGPSSNGERPTPSAQEEALAFALREAVTNVLRHARATRCQVSLEHEDGLVRLAVQDDGRGGAEAPNGTSGAGLTGMRERVEALGGRLTVRDNGGTTVTVELPVPERSRGNLPRRPAPRSGGGVS